MTRWFNRDGTPAVTADVRKEPELWAQQMRAYNFNKQYRFVARTEFANPRLTVSTVFLGIDHRFGEGRPLIFETMVFRRKRAGEYYKALTNGRSTVSGLSGKSLGRPHIVGYGGKYPRRWVVTGDDVFCMRYSTEEEALEGHKDACTLLEISRELGRAEEIFW